MADANSEPFHANGRTYAPPPRPVVVICLDGCSDEYLDAALLRGQMPQLERFCLSGYRGLARGALPSFTNVNNVSIATGAPPSIHGIGGNFFYDSASDQEVMMNSAKFLRAETLFAAAAHAGRKVAVVTAKEKLRDLFAHGLIECGGIAFSSEQANRARKGTHGLEDVEKLVGVATPPIYSAEASWYVLQSGVALLEAGMADFLYLSTTDFIQHKFAPVDAQALEFYRGVDQQLGRLFELGAVIGLTADHGMNAKSRLDGSPNVIYLQTELDRQFQASFRVILPITDPYVVHHGALGSFAVVHIPASCSTSSVSEWLMSVPGITEVYEREIAVQKLELPRDRLGELVVLAGRDVVLGRTPEWHDLTGVKSGLRSHGGRYEEMVPFIFSHPLQLAYGLKAAGDPRNFDVFDFTVNGTDLGNSHGRVEK